MSIDILKLRKDTLGIKNVIHFNNAGAALMTKGVVDKIISYIKVEESIGGYEARRKYDESLNEVYKDAATLLNCDENEIAYCDSASRAWNLLFSSIPFSPGDRVLTTHTEYVSNYIMLAKYRLSHNIEVEVIPKNKNGITCLESLKSMLDERVKAVSITYISANKGEMSPVQEIGEIVSKYKIFYLVDACQALGHVPVDVKKIKCNMLTTTGRKYLRGPRGTAMLYLSKNIVNRLEPSFLELYNMRKNPKGNYLMKDNAQCLETWEQNFAAKVGFGAALKYMLKLDINELFERIIYLAAILTESLKQIQSVQLLEKGSKLNGIIPFKVQGKKVSYVFNALSLHKINVDVSEEQHTPLDNDKSYDKEFIRASLHYYNTEEEIENFTRIISKISK